MLARRHHHIALAPKSSCHRPHGRRRHDRSQALPLALATVLIGALLANLSGPVLITAAGRPSNSAATHVVLIRIVAALRPCIAARTVLVSDRGPRARVRREARAADRACVGATHGLRALAIPATLSSSALLRRLARDSMRYITTSGQTAARVAPWVQGDMAAIAAADRGASALLKPTARALAVYERALYKPMSTTRISSGHAPAPVAPRAPVPAPVAPRTPVPTTAPTVVPTSTPTTVPTNTPTNTPTMVPTNTPTNTPIPPTSTPTRVPVPADFAPMMRSLAGIVSPCLAEKIKLAQDIISFQSSVPAASQAYADGYYTNSACQAAATQLVVRQANSEQ